MSVGAFLVNVTVNRKSLKCNNVILFTIYFIMFQIIYLHPSNVTFKWLSTVLRIQQISVVFWLSTVLRIQKISVVILVKHCASYSTDLSCILVKHCASYSADLSCNFG